jgi:quercetin dioxygenase-like cupin family protein
MMKKLILAAAGMLLFASGYVVGQRQPPPQNTGYRDELLRSLNLEREFPSTAGRTFRMRKITLQPGGMLARHDHNDRPALTYVLEGQVTYRQEGKPDVVIKAGEGAAEGRGAPHWAENTGKVPAVWIGVDIPKQ